ncbi:MAG: bacteriohemerythrin [Gammaproteobacteria bacterium]
MADKKHEDIAIESIDIFPWNDHFNTGITEIDEQHQRLVQLLNSLATHMAFQSGTQTLDIVFKELTDYTVYHFLTEETIWHEHLPENALETKHKEEHNNFISTVLSLKAKKNSHSADSMINELLSFLVRWLASHILESDKYMALVVLAIQSGASPDQAERQANEQMNSGMKSLIDIILSTYSSLATNTIQLMKEAAKRKQTEQQLRISAEQLEQTVQSLDKANKSLKQQYIDSIKTFANIIEMRPGIKSGQSKYIIEKATLVAREMSLNAEEKKNILYAGLLMQIGKMSLPDTLLEKSFHSIPLADKQRYLRHAVEGEALLNGLTQLKGASVLIRHQYERYDGTGLPDSLARQKIPIGSRILSVVSDYIAYLEGAMTGEAMSVSAAISQLISRKESYYDPAIVDAFIKTLKEDITVEMEEDLPVIKKSWKNSRLASNSQKTAVERPVLEISWIQLKPGMEIDSIYFDNKPYIRNCIADQKLISSITEIRENTGSNPVVKIRMGAK